MGLFLFKDVSVFCYHYVIFIAGCINICELYDVIFIAGCINICKLYDVIFIAGCINICELYDVIKSPKQCLETYCFCSISSYYYSPTPPPLSFFLSFFLSVAHELVHGRSQELQDRIS